MQQAFLRNRKAGLAEEVHWLPATAHYNLCAHYVSQNTLDTQYTLHSDVLDTGCIKMMRHTQIALDIAHS